MRRVTALCAIAFILSPMAHAMDLKVMTRASGLAKVVALADECKYEIDDEKLEVYYRTNKMDDPEVFDFIQNSITMEQMDTPTSSDCVMAKSTGNKIGILK